MRLVDTVTDPSGEPVDRLTRICEAMTKAMEAHPEFRPGDRAIVVLSDGDGIHGGMTANGYDDTREALADMLAHTQAVAISLGLGMDVLSVPIDASGLDDEGGRHVDE